MKFKDLLPINKDSFKQESYPICITKKKYMDFDIYIENLRGDYREGTDDSGKKWKTKLYYDYGYIKDAIGNDKDYLDCFINWEVSDKIFVINQTDKDGNFDEHKCIFGAQDKKEAEKIYLSNYEKDWNQYSKVDEYNINEFKEWLEDL